MGQVLHSSATTTQAVRRAIQNSQESLRTLAKRYGINQKTVAKWKKRTSVDDLTTGPKNPRSSVLSPEDEAAIVAFRKRTLLPLDDFLYALQPSIPYLTRSSLHRCLQRHGISRLPEVQGDRPVRKRFKSYPLVTFISTSLRCKQHRVSFISSLPLIALPSLRSLNCILKPVRWQPRSSCAIWLRLCPIESIRC